MSPLLYNGVHRLAATCTSSASEPASSSSILTTFPQAVIEITAGVGTLTHAYKEKGVRPHLLSEKAMLKQRVVAHAFPHAQISAEALDIDFPLPTEQYVHISAGLPCQPFAPRGARRADAPMTTWRSGSAATPPCRDKQLSLITTSLGFGGAISVG